MRPLRCLTLALLTAALLAPVSSCASKGPTPLVLPRAADLQVEAKPRLDPAALESEAALERHDNAVEAWGERGWATVGRLCRWAERNGMRIDCPPADGE